MRTIRKLVISALMSEGEWRCRAPFLDAYFVLRIYLCSSYRVGGRLIMGGIYVIFFAN